MGIATFNPSCLLGCNLVAVESGRDSWEHCLQARLGGETFNNLSGLVLRAVAQKAAISMPDNFHNRSFSRLKIKVEGGMASSSGWSLTANVLKSS